MKTTEELIEEFIKNGGQIETLEAIEPEHKKLVGFNISSNKDPVRLMSLLEGAELFTKKQKVKKKKTKKLNIDMSLIPENIKNLLEKELDSE
jgi:hypothetical protein